MGSEWSITFWWDCLLWLGGKKNIGFYRRNDIFFQEAIKIARHREAKSGELRAATSLARLLVKPDEKEEALTVVEPIYYWFSEGFDTADLKDAKALLDDIS